LSDTYELGWALKLPNLKGIIISAYPTPSYYVQNDFTVGGKSWPLKTPEGFRKFMKSLRGLIPSKNKDVLMNIPADAQMYVHHLGVIGEWRFEEDEVDEVGM
jgi:hypothetical protein